MYQLCLFSNKNPTGVYIMMGSNYYLFQYSIDVKQNNYGNKKINRSKNISKIAHFNLVQFMNVKENKDQSYDLPVL
jgi:hypothetical protein